MMHGQPRFLFIKLKHFGDVLLLSPALAAVRRAYPQAHIAVVVREGTEKILPKDGLIDEIHLTVPPEKKRRRAGQLLDGLRLLRRLRERCYDYVFELTDGDRGRWLGALCRAKARCASSYGWHNHGFWRLIYRDLLPDDWNQCHRVEKDHMLVRHFLRLPSGEVPPLGVSIPEKLSGSIEPPTGHFAIIHPATRWKRKQWPRERWAAVGRFLVSQGLSCVISCGPDEEEIVFARALRDDIGPAAASCTEGRASWGDLGWLLSRARLFVGLDTAAMHLAAGCARPVVALFGPSIDPHWHPWRTAYEIVSSPPQLTNVYPDFMYDALKRSMDGITVEAVTAACERMLNQANEGGHAR